MEHVGTRYKISDTLEAHQEATVTVNQLGKKAVCLTHMYFELNLDKELVWYDKDQWFEMEDNFGNSGNLIPAPSNDWEEIEFHPHAKGNPDRFAKIRAP